MNVSVIFIANGLSSVLSYRLRVWSLHAWITHSHISSAADTLNMSSTTADRVSNTILIPMPKRQTTTYRSQIILLMRIAV
jgi:hypothetical protein